jgi:YVTN family beta-propeller protein
MSFAPCPNKLLAVSDVATVIDCDSNFIKTSLSVGGSAVKVDTFHGKAYCTNVYAGAVYVIDMRGDSLLKTIALGRYPLELCWNQTNSRAYIADHMDDVVYVVRDTSVGVREHSEKRIAFLLRRASLVGWQSLVARGLEGTLRDASGRDVARLPSGTGSLCELRAGVYFLQPVGQATACKVVLQK